MALAPLSLPAGAVFAAGTLLVLVALTWATPLVLSAEERAQLQQLLQQGFQKLAPYLPGRRSATGSL
jgi:hypothetical protein